MVEVGRSIFEQLLEFTSGHTRTKLEVSLLHELDWTRSTTASSTYSI